MPEPHRGHRPLRNLGPLDAGSDPTTLVPAVFERALAGLAAVELRPELDREQLPAPRRLASYSYAGSVAVLGPAEPGGEAEEVGSGRFVLLYEPDGHPEWQGVFRCVTLIQVDLETEIAEDRLLPEVAWSWLTEAFELRGARFAALGGTVSQCASTRFGDLARAAAAADGPAGPGSGPGSGPTGGPNLGPGAGTGPGSGSGSGQAAGPGMISSGSAGSSGAAAATPGNPELGSPGLRTAGSGGTGAGSATAAGPTGLPSIGLRPSGPQLSSPGDGRSGEGGAGDLTGVVEPIEHSLELRASWTPLLQAGPGGRAPSPEEAYVAIQAHFQAWSDLLSAAAGLPPVMAAGISSLPGGPRR